MAAQAEVIRGNIRANQERETQRQIGNVPQTEELANGIPASGSNDAALAAHLREMRDTNAEYARLRTEEARAQWEAIETANFQRDAANKQNIADQVSNARANQEKENRIVGDSLALQMQELTDSFPPNWTPETLPLDKLQKLSNLRQRVQDLARATGAQGLADGVLESGGPLAPQNVLGLNQKPPKVSPQDAGKVTQNDDGTWTVTLQTGETFKGTAAEVMQQQAAAQVNTKLWARHRAAQAQQQPAAEPIQQQPGQPSGSLADDLLTRQADSFARTLGFSDINEARQWGENINQKIATIQDYENEKLATRFVADCPDFPGTPESVNAVTSIIENNGWEYNVQSLQAAHALAVRNNVYQPLTAEQIQIANGAMPQNTRPVPPPMLSGNNPELATLGSNDPYQMPLAELRRQAMKQELEGKGPNYR